MEGQKTGWTLPRCYARGKNAGSITNLLALLDLTQNVVSVLYTYQSIVESQDTVPYLDLIVGPRQSRSRSSFSWLSTPSLALPPIRLLRHLVYHCLLLIYGIPKKPFQSVRSRHQTVLYPLLCFSFSRAVADNRIPSATPQATTALAIGLLDFLSIWQNLYAPRSLVPLSRSLAGKIMPSFVFRPSLYCGLYDPGTLIFNR